MRGLTVGLLVVVLAAGCGRKPTESDAGPAPAGTVATPASRTAPTSRAAPPAGPTRAESDAEAVGLAKDRLKAIGKAMHAYESVIHNFPAGYTAEPGKVGLSWRVQLLPHLGEEKLFARFQFDEPWDGPTNKALLAAMPKVFASPGRAAPDGHTYLRTFVGLHAFIPVPFPEPPAMPPGRLFPGRLITEITDGTSNTLMVVEAAEAVPWTKAEELPFPGFLASGAIPVPKLGGVFADGFHGLMCDGQVRFFSATLDDAAIRKVISVNGNDEPFPPDLEKALYPNGRPKPNPDIPPPVKGK